MTRVACLNVLALSLLLTACGPPDEVVQERVNQAVAFKEWSWIQATVTKGQLTLDGLAPDEEVLTEAGPLLAQVVGVKGVVNHLALDTALVRRRTQAAECSTAVMSILTARPVRFAGTSARIQAASNRILDEVAVALAGCPDATFEATGTMAANGTANPDLSRRRTQAVVDYLVAKGVAGARLVAAPDGGSVIGMRLKAH